MPLQLGTKIRSGYVIAFILLLVTYFLIFYSVKNLAAGTQNISVTHNLINKVEALQVSMMDAESSVRSFIINPDPNLLNRYYAAQREIPILRTGIQNLNIQNNASLADLAGIDTLIRKSLDLHAAALSQLQTNRESNFNKLDYLNSSHLLNSQLRQLIDHLKLNEENRMSVQNARLERFFNSTDIIALCSLIIAMLTILFAILTFNRQNKARKKADNERKKYQEELETNIKELRKVNAELDELKQIEKFASTGRIARTIAHEVRNPLTNITLATEQLEERYSAEEDSALLLDMISRNAGRIDHLVADLLQSTRFAELDFVKVDLKDLVEETLDFAKDRIDLKQIQVIRDYSEKPLFVMVDRQKIKIALLNIIVNAIESMTEGSGKLTLKTAKKGNFNTISIGDNGIGMDKESLSKIFDPFYTGKQNGTGLGLTNSQNIIFNHKGKINVRSEIRKGTTFSIILEPAG